MSHNMLPKYLKFCIFLQYAYYVRPSILCTPLWNGPMQWDPMSSSLQYDIGQYPTFAKCNIMQYAHFTRPPCWRCASWAWWRGSAPSSRCWTAQTLQRNWDQKCSKLFFLGMGKINQFYHLVFSLPTDIMMRLWFCYLIKVKFPSLFF